MDASSRVLDLVWDDLKHCDLDSDEQTHAQTAGDKRRTSSDADSRDSAISISDGVDADRGDLTRAAHVGTLERTFDELFDVSFSLTLYDFGKQQ